MPPYSGGVVAVIRGPSGGHRGCPGILKLHPKPKTPHDLLSHKCINFRDGSAGLYRWEFDKGKKSVSVAVNGPLTVDNVKPWFALRLMASALPVR